MVALGTGTCICAWTSKVRLFGTRRISNLHIWFDGLMRVGVSRCFVAAPNWVSLCSLCSTWIQRHRSESVQHPKWRCIRCPMQHSRHCINEATTLDKLQRVWNKLKQSELEFSREEVTTLLSSAQIRHTWRDTFYAIWSASHPTYSMTTECQLSISVPIQFANFSETDLPKMKIER